MHPKMIDICTHGRETDWTPLKSNSRQNLDSHPIKLTFDWFLYLMSSRKQNKKPEQIYHCSTPNPWSLHPGKVRSGFSQCLIFQCLLSALRIKPKSVKTSLPTYPHFFLHCPLHSLTTSRPFHVFSGLFVYVLPSASFPISSCLWHNYIHFPDSSLAIIYFIWKTL